MATNPKTLAEALAAYDTVQKQKDRVLRNDYVAGQQAIRGISNFLRQSGHNGGATESAFLKVQGIRSDTSDYDLKLADLAALISRFRNKSMGGGAVRQPTIDERPTIDESVTEKLPISKQDRILKSTTADTYKRPTTSWLPTAAASRASAKIKPQLLGRQHTLK